MINIEQIAARIQPLVMGWIAGGTAFPANPNTGQQFFRTDLGWWCYWNGTYWLTCHEYTLGSMMTQSTCTATTTLTYGVLRSDYQLYGVRIDLMVNATSLQDASNYWTITPRMINAAYSASSSLGTRTTTGITTGTAVTYPITITNPTNAANKYWFDVSFAKTGSAGNLANVSVNFAYKLIVT